MCVLERRLGCITVVAVVAVCLCSCSGLMHALHARPVSRPEGLNCVRYEFVYRTPHLGSDQWGSPEFVRIGYLAPGEYDHNRHHGEYVACPAPSAPDQSLTALWRDYRSSLERNGAWDYHEAVTSEAVAPLALEPSEASRTTSINGTLYRIDRYYAYFQGCDYWATDNSSYECR